RIINACVDIPPRMVESAMKNFYLCLCQCQERHLAVSGKNVSNKIDVFLSGESDSEIKNEGMGSEIFLCSHLFITSCIYFNALSDVHRQRSRIRIRITENTALVKFRIAVSQE
ncbi:hypothetical protein PV326_002302, partial [Microctonus aethiopoides]